MRLKYYMRGLGIGILFSVIVSGLTGANNKATMSDAEIIHAAKALGMVEAQSQVDLTDLSPTVKPTVEPTVEPTQEPTPTLEPTATPTPLPTPEPTETPVVEESGNKQTITLNIVKGMYSHEVAEEAYRIGLVESVEEFDQYLINNGYASRIHINSYEFELGATEWEIAEKITTPR